MWVVPFYFHFHFLNIKKAKWNHDSMIWWLYHTNHCNENLGCAAGQHSFLLSLKAFQILKIVQKYNLSIWESVVWSGLSRQFVIFSRRTPFSCQKKHPAPAHHQHHNQYKISWSDHRLWMMPKEMKICSGCWWYPNIKEHFLYEYIMHVWHCIRMSLHMPDLSPTFLLPDTPLALAPQTLHPPTTSHPHP